MICNGFNYLEKIDSINFMKEILLLSIWWRSSQKELKYDDFGLFGYGKAKEKNWEIEERDRMV